MEAQPASEAPRIVDGRPLLVAGFSGRYARDAIAGIPAQWERFGPHIGRVPGQVEDIAYGVCYNFDAGGGIDYLCGVEVRDASALPADFVLLRIAAQRYAVFAHRGHVSTIQTTWAAIWGRWLPQSGCETVSAPCFERYGPEFDGQTGLGGFEIWVPVKPK